MQYSFLDNDLAARRLRVLADVYADSTRAFLLEAAAGQPQLVVDLGCGPGHTTHLLAEVLGCHMAVGLDNSERFLALARLSETEQVAFQLHDVTSVPFPVAPSDLIYCRLC